MCPGSVESARWRGAPVLLPAIDRHGWHDDYRPMTSRAIRARLCLAAQRAGPDLPDGSDAGADAQGRAHRTAPLAARAQSWS